MGTRLCFTGEEAYSIAMCLLERMAKLSSNIGRCRSSRRDLSEGALARAREGRYLVNIARDVSPERLRRFFTKEGDYYLIRADRSAKLRLFARHDLTLDPPYSRLDLVSCRNVLIYLEPRLQELVFATFHYALRPDGFLIVGPAETVGSVCRRCSLRSTRSAASYSRKTVSGPARLLAVRGNANPARRGRPATLAPPANRRLRKCHARRIACCWLASGLRPS